MDGHTTAATQPVVAPTRLQLEETVGGTGLMRKSASSCPFLVLGMRRPTPQPSLIRKLGGACPCGVQARTAP
jgi:hypothetical protein